MGFYDFHLFEDNAAKTFMIIIEKINSMIDDCLKNYLKNKDLIKILTTIYQEFIIDIISVESPKFQETKIVNIFNYLFYSLLNRYKILYDIKYNSITKLCSNKKAEFIQIIEKLINNSKNSINAQINIYHNEKKKYEEKLKELKISDRVKEIALKEYKTEHNYKYYIIPTNIIINEYINSYQFEKLKKNNNIVEPHYDYKWENYLNEMERIEKELLAINGMTNTQKIKDTINDNIIQNNEFIEKTRYEQYIKIRKQLNSLYENKNSLIKIHYSKWRVNNKNEFNIYQINFEKLEDMYELIDILKELITKSYFNNLPRFSVENKKYAFDNFQDKQNKQSFNFIFMKNSNPVFLNKYMKINLGLYILNHNNRDNIGSITIQNNFTKELEYNINQDTSNSILVSNINNKKLKEHQDLTLNFKLNVKNVELKFYKSKFDLNLYNCNKECDKCIIYIFINIIPLIIKFSIKDEKFFLNSNSISIQHYLEKLKILYCFPGNYIPKSLGIEIISNKINKSGIDKNIPGQIIIQSKESKFDFIKYELNLFFKSSLLLNFNVKYKKPKYSGLIIFNEKNIDISNLEIMKDLTENIYLFNMTCNKMLLDLNYDKSQIEIKFNNKEINPGEYLKLEVKNINIKNTLEVKICDQFIKIEDKVYPQINKNGKFSKCDFEGEVGHNFKLYFINNNFELKKVKYMKEIISIFQLIYF